VKAPRSGERGWRRAGECRGRGLAPSARSPLRGKSICHCHGERNTLRASEKAPCCCLRQRHLPQPVANESSTAPARKHPAAACGKGTCHSLWRTKAAPRQRESPPPLQVAKAPPRRVAPPNRCLRQNTFATCAAQSRQRKRLRSSVHYIAFM